MVKSDLRSARIRRFEKLLAESRKRAEKAEQELMAVKARASQEHAMVQALVPAKKPDGEMERVAALPRRQKAILMLIAQGKNAKEIADILHISFKTVNNHRGFLMHRLGVHDTATLTKIAVRCGIAPLDD